MAKNTTDIEKNTPKREGADLSNNQWHFKLQKWTFPRMDPVRFTNLCPYFWLSIGCILLIPWTLFHKILLFIPKLIANWMEASMDKWLDSVPVTEAENMRFGYGGYGTFLNKRYIRKKYSGGDLYGRWFEKKYKKSWWELTDEERKEIWKQIEGESKVITKEEAEKRAEERARQEERDRIKREKQAIKEEAARQRREKRRKQHERVSAFFEANFRAPLRGLFSKMRMPKSGVMVLINVTKKFMGLLLTLIMAAAVFFVIGYVARFLVWFVGWVQTWPWDIILIVLACTAAVATVILILVLIVKWFIHVEEQVRCGKKMPLLARILWKGICIPFYWVVKVLIWWPVYYVVVWPIWKFCQYPGWWFVYYVLYWGICRPVFWVFKMLAKGIWALVGGFLGIFVEYYKAEKGGVCPGINWQHLEEDDN